MVGVDILHPASGLADGQSLPGAQGWQVLHVPGHTDDSIALWHNDSGTLVGGDAVLSSRGKAWFTPETVDTATARGSERRLRRLHVEHLLPGHGRPVHDTNVFIDMK
jgi:glyoxylase-like metal-dependent hydrolase (beta-lactamase superfamily II)